MIKNINVLYTRSTLDIMVKNCFNVSKFVRQRRITIQNERICHEVCMFPGFPEILTFRYSPVKSSTDLTVEK